MSKAFCASLLVGLGATLSLNAQESRSLPFLEVSSDARSAAMGGSTMGEARSAYLYTNPTSLLTAEGRIYGSYSFGKYTSSELSEIQYHTVSAGYRLGSRHAFLLGSRYYKGLPTHKEDEYGERKQLKPMDYSVDIAYAYAFSDHLSAYVVGTFIQSYVGKVAFTGGGSVGLYYRNAPVSVETPLRYTIGLSADNIGGKVQYGKKGYEGKMPGSVAVGGDLMTRLTDQIGVGISMTHRLFFTPNNASRYTGGIGLEADYMQKGFVRAGMQLMHESNVATFGAGCRLGAITLDGTYRKGMKDSGVDSFWVGLSVNF